MHTLTRTILKRLSRRAKPYLASSGLLQLAGEFNRSALLWTPQSERVLVLAPHMDDETIGCGGTLALHAQRGAHITVAFLTDGAAGDSEINTLKGAEREHRRRALIGVRRAEAQAALALLGVQDLRFLDGRDGELAGCTSVIGSLRALLRDCAPQLVYLPWFLEQHRDHAAVSKLLLAAFDPATTSFQCMAYEVWTPLFPNCFVDIGATVELKRTALSQYRSQLAQADYTRAALGLNAYRALALSAGVDAHAEAFWSAPIAEYLQQYRSVVAARTA